MQMSLVKKEENLVRILEEAGSALIAFSGGVDSSYLLFKAAQVMGKEKVLAVTAASEIHPLQEKENAARFARQYGFEHLVIQTNELACPVFSSNPPERCYYCKQAMLLKLTALAKEYGLNRVCDGANYDDTGDFRPGMKAARELNVLSPLMEVELTKDEIRRLSQKAGLNTWNLPSAACLCSRIPYGEIITTEKLKMIGDGERFLTSLDINGVRVRFHDKIARIEVFPESFQQLLRHKEAIVNRFKELGFAYITVDLEGFRSGSMNDVLNDETKFDTNNG